MNLAILAPVLALLTAGCVAPIGADRVTTRRAYEQVESNALRTGRPSADTVSLLHQYNLGRLAERRPDEAVRQLHPAAVSSGRRDLLFALAELSFVAAEDIRRSVKPWDPRDARDFYLGSAVYSWLYLFGDGRDAPPNPFDRRFREACDFYNRSLGLALTERRATNAVAVIEGGRRPLPVGALNVTFNEADPMARRTDFEEFLLADLFEVRGLSVRVREAGLGAPLIAVRPVSAEFGARSSAPVTAFLNIQSSLTDLSNGQAGARLTLHSAWEAGTVPVGDRKIPLETDLTTFRAYNLNQSFVWKLGMMEFLSPSQRIKSQLILNQPYLPGRIPVVFVHGTFSSPVTWAEMANTLISDPVLRERYQVWTFIYGSGNPLVISADAFRKSLTETVQKLDPEGRDPALREVVVVGHSQGGLLTKMAVTETGDQIWRRFSSKSIDSEDLEDSLKARARELMFLKPLPFIRRVVFICTPHRGSYRASGFVRGLARRLTTLSANIVSQGKELLKLADQVDSKEFPLGKIGTSLDGMSPRNPVIKALAEIPVTDGVKAHSLIAINGPGDPEGRADGIVSYSSAHVSYVDSEFIVRGPHTCLNQPDTIGEVRRILLEHLTSITIPAPAAGTPP